jgi:hypothetical protein
VDDEEVPMTQESQRKSLTSLELNIRAIGVGAMLVLTGVASLLITRAILSERENTRKEQALVALRTDPEPRTEDPTEKGAAGEGNSWSTRPTEGSKDQELSALRQTVKDLVPPGAASKQGGKRPAKVRRPGSSAVEKRRSGVAKEERPNKEDPSPPGTKKDLPEASGKEESTRAAAEAKAQQEANREDAIAIRREKRIPHLKELIHQLEKARRHDLKK